MNTLTWKGTGCVKITPAHDFNDYEVGKRHQLTMINMMDLDGNVRNEAEIFDTNGNPSTAYSCEIPEAYRGMERFAARKAIVAEFEQLGLLVEVKPHDLTVPYGDRGGVVIEPMLTDHGTCVPSLWLVMPLKPLKMAVFSSFLVSTKTCISLGCVIFKTGVFLANCGGATAFLHGMTKKAMSTWVAMKTKFVVK